MKKLDQIRQESKEIKDKIDNTEERLRQLKNQEQKILKQDIEKRKKTEELLLGFLLSQNSFSPWRKRCIRREKGLCGGTFSSNSV